MEEKAAVVDEVMAVAAANDDDLGEAMQCSDHPYRTNPGGICAFCLQEKLGKLLSTATPTSFFTTTTTTTLANPSSSAASTAAAAAAADILLLRRSKSVAPRPIGDVADTPRKKKKKHFWSFLYHHSSSSSATPAAAKINQQQTADAEGGSQALSSSSGGRRVARSRSVGCGSRSFSGDFLERISTGLGDCTLRRVESQRETRKRAAADAKMAKRNVRESRMKERMRCGGIFRGFGTSSTPSSSSSSYWLSAAGEDDFGKGEGGRIMSSSSSSSAWRRNRNWGWTFASPMRAFKPVVSASKSTFGNANAVASINRSTGVGSGNANPPSSLLVGGG